MPAGSQRQDEERCVAGAIGQACGARVLWELRPNNHLSLGMRDDSAKVELVEQCLDARILEGMRNDPWDGYAPTVRANKHMYQTSDVGYIRIASGIMLWHQSNRKPEPWISSLSLGWRWFMPTSVIKAHRLRDNNPSARRSSIYTIPYPNFC